MFQPPSRLLKSTPGAPETNKDPCGAGTEDVRLACVLIDVAALGGGFGAGVVPLVGVLASEEMSTTPILRAIFTRCGPKVSIACHQKSSFR